MRLREGTEAQKMNRLQGSSRPQHNSTSGTNARLNDSEIAAAEARVKEQEAHVLRLIVQGAPTQMAVDVLRQLTAAVEVVKERKRLRPRN
jgi:hypothetical protein